MTGAALALCAPGPAGAAELAAWLRADPAAGPHFMHLAANIEIARHIFEPPFNSDAEDHPMPRPAESWRALDETNFVDAQAARPLTCQPDQTG